MAFVNEYIPEADIEKYALRKRIKQFAKVCFEDHWTIDRERDIHLQYVETGHEDLASHWIFCFYWKGHVFRVELATSGGGEWRGVQKRHYELIRLNIPLFDPLPEFLETQRPEILADLKEALAAFKDLGVLSRSTSHTATFNF